MPTLLVRNAAMLVTMDGQRRELKDAGLYAVDGIIQQMGASASLPTTADEVLDLSGQIVLPGFVNTHHHLNQTLTRCLPAAQDNNLFPWLQAQYRIWAGTTEAASRTSTLVGLAELALSGCTTVFDHTYLYQSGNNVDCQIEAARQLGVRFHASRGSMSLGQSQGGLPPDDCVEDEAFILTDSERVIRTHHDPKVGSMTQVVLAPCSPFSVSTGLLRDSAALARQHGVKLHTHLCETLDEERYTLQRFAMRPVEWMETLGWLGDDVWFAHTVHVSDSEIQRFAQTGVGAAHCPCSNMRLASGIAPIKKYLAAGVKVGLGVDGSASNDASNMLLEVRQTMLLARLALGLRPADLPPPPPEDWMTAREALELATLGGAKVLGRQDIGSLEPGKCADFFTLDLHTLNYAGALHDPVAAIVFCAPQRVRHTIVHGRPVVKDGLVVTVDMPPVIEEHNRHASRLASAV
ncbi:8-oxoguanine deaminase [Verrucomicrobium sp. BvORR034]|uniref:8-oxoguanine deaminase n=1 Tax=Verrucomicrobium sp. BvORR034 TaxID=1396418 RepID=UPI000678E7B6|nr:8-oxoguanine deaminase [Verrucomicrobium sp. BvORR034]